MSQSKIPYFRRFPARPITIDLRRAQFRVEMKSEIEADFYLENGYVVFTRAYHLRRGTCCGSGCRHCPYGFSR